MFWLHDTAVKGWKQKDEPATVQYRTLQDRKGGTSCPGKKHVRGVGDKEQRMYEHIKESAEKSGRYGERAEEVAARP